MLFPPAFVGPCLVVVLAAGCSDVDALPEDAAFQDCLSAAGIDPDAAEDAEGRRVSFDEPAAMDCLLDPVEADGRNAALSGVFTDEQLRPVLLDWIASHGDRDGEELARQAGELLGAADGEQPDDFAVSWSDEQLHEDLALTIYVQDQGEPASYREWLDDPAEQQSVSASDPVAASTQYLKWLSQQGDREQATAEEIRRLQDLVNDSRDS